MKIEISENAVIFIERINAIALERQQQYRPNRQDDIAFAAIEGITHAMLDAIRPPKAQKDALAIPCNYCPDASAVTCEECKSIHERTARAKELLLREVEGRR